jgi:hypothetical protein
MDGKCGKLGTVERSLVLEKAQASLIGLSEKPEAAKYIRYP